jgi:hypothetical protein
MNYLFRGSVFVYITLAAACLLWTPPVSAARTSIELKTNPRGATVMIFNQDGQYQSEFRADGSPYEVKDSKHFFGLKGRDPSARVTFVLQKQGYKMGVLEAQLLRKEKNEYQFELEEFNTRIVIDGEPKGTQLTFFESAGKRNKRVLIRELAADLAFDSEEARTIAEALLTDKNELTGEVTRLEQSFAPLNLVYTEQEAKAEFPSGLTVRLDSEGYIPETKTIPITPGRTSSIDFRLRELTATLKVVSEIDSVEIEDVRKGTSFGYLGRTPFVREFNAREAVRDDDFKTEQKIKLRLRGTKPGFRDRIVDVEIPWGEEITANIALKARSTQITFQSDPPEVHVYLQRNKHENVYNDSTGEMDEKVVTYFKHLGTTPFTHYMDPEDPIEHDDVIVYRKTGFAEGADRFAAGVNTYHKVLTPLELMRFEN